MNEFVNRPPQGAERRRSARRPARTRVWADPGGVAPVVDCVILDVSDDGAGALMIGGADLPATFQLQADSSTPVAEANVVWRRGNTVGVTLTKTKTP